jgi:uncharacterized protein YlxW (UPF0749 family)
MSGGVVRSVLRRPASWQITLAAALLALGFLVAVQIQSQSPRARYSTQERPPLVETAIELSQRQEALKASIVDLRGQIQAQENDVAAEDAAVAAFNAQLIAARTAAGLTDVTGAGVGLQFDDAPGTLPPGANQSDYRVQAEDLCDLLTALWLNGAQAIAINGERIVTSTAITDIGGTVLVNSAYLAPPYVITAVGAARLYDQLTASDLLRQLLETRVQPFGLQLRAGKLDSVTVPAYSGTLRLIEARPAPSPSPAVTP